MCTEHCCWKSRIVHRGTRPHDVCRALPRPEIERARHGSRGRTTMLGSSKSAKCHLMRRPSREQAVLQVSLGDAPRLPIAIWRNIFVVIDDGHVSLAEIQTISDRVLELGLQNPGGIGGITLIPTTNARPPSEAHRQAIKTAYGRVSRHLKAMCWTVDGQ